MNSHIDFKSPKIIEITLIVGIVIIGVILLFLLLPSHKKAVVRSNAYSFTGILNSTVICFQNISCSVKVGNFTVDTSINGSHLQPGQLKNFANNVITTKDVSRNVLVYGKDLGHGNFSIVGDSNYYIELQN